MFYLIASDTEPTFAWPLWPCLALQQAKRAAKRAAEEAAAAGDGSASEEDMPLELKRRRLVQAGARKRAEQQKQPQQGKQQGKQQQPAAGKKGGAAGGGVQQPAFRIPKQQLPGQGKEAEEQQEEEEEEAQQPEQEQEQSSSATLDAAAAAAAEAGEEVEQAAPAQTAAAAAAAVDEAKQLEGDEAPGGCYRAVSPATVCQHVKPNCFACVNSDPTCAPASTAVPALKPCGPACLRCPAMACPVLPAAALERLVHLPSRGRRRDKLNRLLQAAEVGREVASVPGTWMGASSG